jgi:lysozyme family protein
MTKSQIMQEAEGSPLFIKWLKFILDWECEVDRKTGIILPENMGDGAGITVAGLTARDDEFPKDGITASWVVDTYRARYWVKCYGDKLLQPLGAVLANFGVNCGVETGITMLQLALCDYGQKVNCDGEIGPATLTATMNVGNTKELSLALIGKADARYKRLAAYHPERHARNLKGWLNRNNDLREAFCV